MAEFRIFVSSTFRDLTAERSLLRTVFDDLRKACRSRGHDLHVVDLRWGISEAVQRQGRTMEICLDEIARCQHVSPRPNFLVLLGDRYGWEPAPDCIDQIEFEQLRAAMDANGRELLDRRYWTDANAQPCVKVLDRNGLSGEDESRLLEALRAACRKLEWHDGDERRSKYACSATHQEILLGVRPTGDTTPESHIFATIRDRTGASSGDAAALAGLESFLEQRLGSGNIFRYTAGENLSEPGPANGDAFTSWVKSKYLAVLKEEMDRLDAESRRSQGDGEGDRHRDISRRKSAVFVGRDDEAARIHEDLRAGAGSILVLGNGGTGKSAFMGRLLSRQTPAGTDSLMSLVAPATYRGWVVPTETARDSAHLFGLDAHGNSVRQDRDLIRETIRQVLDIESPIHVDSLCHRVSMRWGFKSRTKRVRAAVGTFLSDPALVQQDGDFCWIPGSKAEQMPPRTHSAEWRTGKEVHEAEVRGALVFLLERSHSEGIFSVKRSSLVAETKRIFGITKEGLDLGAKVDGLIDGCAASLGWTATKTSLTHQSAKAERREAGKVRSLVRFVGETARSSSYTDLLRSLMDELLPRRIVAQVNRTGDPSVLLDEWRAALEEVAAIGPVRIYLDGVDQLRGAPANAAAIVPREIPKGIQFVISSTPRPLAFLPRSWDRTIVLPGFDPAYARDVLRAWLKHAGRCLQQTQEVPVLERCNRIEDGQALCIRLVAGATAGWPSTVHVDPQALSDWSSLEGILTSGLRRLDGEHTSSICSHMTRHCAVSRRGLSEDELQQSLLGLPGFWSGFVAQQHADHRDALEAGHRVPDAVMSLVLSDLRGVYLKELGGHFQPAHRLVGEFVLRDAEARVTAAQAVARAFAAEPWFLSQAGIGRETANTRKVVELPHALSLAGQHSELLSECLANLDCLVAAVVAGELGALFEVEIPQGHELSGRATALRARLRAAPETILARRRAVEVEEYLSGNSEERADSSGRRGVGRIHPVPKLERVGRAAVVDVDLASARILLWYGERNELQERSLITGEVRSTEPALAGILGEAQGSGPKQIVVGLDGVVRSRSHSQERDLVAGPSGFGALDTPAIELGDGRRLGVHRRLHAFEVRYHGLKGNIALQPSHTATVTALAATLVSDDGQSVLVASGGRDRKLCIWRLSQDGSEVKHLHEHKFDGQVAHVHFAGPRYLLAFCQDAASRGAQGNHPVTYDLFRLDLSADRAEWDQRWALLHQGINGWANPMRRPDPQEDDSYLWLIDGSGVVQIDLTSTKITPIKSIASPSRTQLELVAPGVGYVKEARASFTEPEIHTIVRRGMRDVRVCSITAVAMPQSRFVVALRSGTLACLEQFDRGDGEPISCFLTLRCAKTLEERARRQLPARLNLDGNEPVRWRSLAVTRETMIQVAGDDVILEFDSELVPMGQNHGWTEVGVMQSQKSHVLAGLRSNLPQLIRRDRCAAVFYPDGSVYMFDETLHASDVGMVRARNGVESHQQLLSDGTLTLVEGGGFRRIAHGSAPQREVALPTSVRKHVGTGEVIALIDADGGFWVPLLTGSKRPAPWRHGTFSCLDALCVGRGTWIVATVEALIRLQIDGDHEVLHESAAMHVELLGGNGSHALCRVDDVLYAVTDSTCVSLDCAVPPSADVHMSSMGVPKLLEMDRVAGTVRVVRLDGTEISCLNVGTHALDPRYLDPQLHELPVGLVANHPQGGWTLHPFDGTNPLALVERIAGLQDVRCTGGLPDSPLIVAQCRDVDGSSCLRLFDVAAGRLVAGVPTEVEELWVAKTRIAWICEGEFVVGSIVNGRAVELVTILESLTDPEIVVARESDTFHVLDDGLCWTVTGGGTVLGPAPYIGPIYVQDHDGQLVVRHLSGFTSVAGAAWQRQFAPVEHFIALTIDHEHLVCAEGDECCVRRIATDEVVARFSLPRCDPKKITFTTDLMVYEEAEGVLSLRCPAHGWPAPEDPGALHVPQPKPPSSAGAADPNRQRYANQSANGTMRWIGLCGMDQASGVVMALPHEGMNQEEREAAAHLQQQRIEGRFDPSRPNPRAVPPVLSSMFKLNMRPAALVMPDGQAVPVDPFEHLVMQAGLLPLLATGRRLSALATDGTKHDLQVPADWWTEWPKELYLPGPDVRIRLEGGVFDWRHDVANSGPVEIPEGWRCAQVLGVDQPLVLIRNDDQPLGAASRSRALYSPVDRSLHALADGAWRFHARTGGGMIAVRAQLVQDDHSGQLKKSTTRWLWVSEAQTPANIKCVHEFEVPSDAYSDLEYDAWRECFWYITADNQLHMVGVDGSAPFTVLEHLHGLPIGRWGSGAPRHMLHARSPLELARLFGGFRIHCLPDALLIVREAMPPASHLIAFDVATKAERRVSGISVDYEFIGFRWIAGRRMLAYLEDVRPAPKRAQHVAMLVELGAATLDVKAPSTLMMAVDPSSDPDGFGALRNGSVHVVPAGVVALRTYGARTVLQLLSSETLEVLREASLPTSFAGCRVWQAEHAIFVWGDFWAACIALESSVPPSVQHWSPPFVSVDHEALDAVPLPGPAGYRIGLPGRMQASWDSSGRLLGWGDLPSSTCCPIGECLCCLLLTDGTVLIGGENGEVTRIAADAVTTRLLWTDEKAAGNPKKGWQVLGLYRAPRDRVAAVYRNGVVLVFEPSSGDIVFLWEPRNKGGDVHPQKHVVCVEDRGQLYMWISERHAKVMELGSGLVWTLDLGATDCERIAGPVSELSATYELILQRAARSVDCLVLPASGVATGFACQPRQLGEGSVVPSVPGKSWHTSVHTPNGLHGGTGIVPIDYEAGLHVAGNRGGTVWAVVSRNRRTRLRVHDSAGTLLTEWTSAPEKVAKERYLRGGSTLERLPLAVSPDGALVAVLLEEAGGTHARVFTATGSRNWLLEGVQDLWFTTDRSCLAVKADGALDRVDFDADSDSCMRTCLTPPLAGLAWALDGDRRLVRDDKAERIRLYEKGVLVHEAIYPVRGTDRIAFTPCRAFVAVGSSAGVLSIFKVEDGSSCPSIFFPDHPEWKEIMIGSGRVWGLTVEGRLETREWEPW